MSSSHLWSAPDNEGDTHVVLVTAEELGEGRGARKFADQQASSGRLLGKKCKMRPTDTTIPVDSLVSPLQVHPQTVVSTTPQRSRKRSQEQQVFKFQACFAI